MEDQCDSEIFQHGWGCEVFFRRAGRPGSTAGKNACRYAMAHIFVAVSQRKL
jgi:hypothetical protein